MEWKPKQKAKFGIRTGQTLRRNYPSLRYYYSRGSCFSTVQEYAIVKEVKLNDPIARLSFDKNSVDKLAIDDGGLPSVLNDSSIIYSMNKRKRWLLPDIVKQDVERLYWEEISQAEQTTTKQCSRKPCKKVKTEDTATLRKARVTVVERHAGSNIDRGHPDCIGVTSSSHCLNSGKPQRKPRKKFAFVGDLKSKTPITDDVELCYEFLSPFPKQSWPTNRQLGGRKRKYFYINDLNGKKSSKKCKGRRNKSYMRPDVDIDDAMLTNNIQDKVTDEEGAIYSDRAYTFPLGAYIEDMFENKNPRTACQTVNNNKVVPSSPTLYGKGDAIFVEKESNAFTNEHIDNNFKTDKPMTQVEPIIKDRKVKLNVLVRDIAPKSLLQQFGNNYIEGDICPRTFVVTANFGDNLHGNASESIDDFCLLFEVADLLASTSDFVEADVSMAFLSEDVTPRNLLQTLASDLTCLGLVGPLTVKAIVDRTVETIISEVVSTPKDICTKNAALSLAKPTIDFIHNVCERKPEICGFRDAARYSTENSGAKENLAPFHRVSIDKPCQRCCGICFVEEDSQLEIDFTSLLRCSHHFCNDCWTIYIASCIRMGQSCITCPNYKCKTVVEEPHLWARTNSDVYRRYTQLKRQVAIDMNQQLRHCPAASCTHIAHVDASTKAESSTALPVLCKCGEIWCFGCQKDAHWPASCEEAESYRKKCDDHQNLKKTYLLPGRISSVQVKRCPFCSHPIEKSRGCQHMICHCGNDFCWECLTPWNGHNWDLCDQSRKELEDVELAFDYGSVRFNKYSKIALENFLERSGKKLANFRRLAKKVKLLKNGDESASFGLETSAYRRLTKCTEKRLGIFLEQVLKFKFLAHLVLENTAAALAISKTKILLKSLDKLMCRLHFVIGRLNEIATQPEILMREFKLENAKLILRQGEKLIRDISIYTRARRNNPTKSVHRNKKVDLKLSFSN